MDPEAEVIIIHYSQTFQVEEEEEVFGAEVAFISKGPVVVCCVLRVVNPQLLVMHLGTANSIVLPFKLEKG